MKITYCPFCQGAGKQTVHKKQERCFFCDGTGTVTVLKEETEI
jgi:DnaJ-class molecular chaperone